MCVSGDCRSEHFRDSIWNANAFLLNLTTKLVHEIVSILSRNIKFQNTLNYLYIPAIKKKRAIKGDY